MPDARHHEYIEESGTMNVLFVLDGTLVTPPLNGSILDGVTRDSVLTLARDRGIPVEERPISYRELVQHLETGTNVEAFGVGTAASVTPIEVISAEGREYFPDASAGALLFGLREELDAVRRGRSADKHGWNYPVGK
jgi:branched-chain amino acid aminotransferase